MGAAGIIVIRGGTVVSETGAVRADVLIRGERIEAVGVVPAIPSAELIDASGLLVLPGAVDPHVHFNDAFMGAVSVHDYESGTTAAAFGGVTSVIDFSNQKPGRPLAETLEVKFREAEDKAVIDWGVHPVVTDARPEVLAEIPGLVESGASTMKCYMTYRQEGLMVGDDELRHVLARLSESGGRLLVHAEDNDIVEDGVAAYIQAGRTAAIDHARSRPPEAENRAIRRLIKLAKDTDGRLFVVHMASAAGLEAAAVARAHGVDILAETCTHYLVFGEAMLERADGIKWICSPPLRDEATREALWRGAADGRIAVVSSDDAAYSWEAKLMGRGPFRPLPQRYSRARSPVVPSLFRRRGQGADHPASACRPVPRPFPPAIFGLAPAKGAIAPGADADIVLFDPSARWTMGLNSLHMAADWSAYEGIEVTGRVVKVFSRGELIVDGESFLGRPGRGRFLKRKPWEERRA